MTDSAEAPMMEEKLCRLIGGIWPEDAEAKVSNGNKWYQTLLSYAKGEGLRPKSTRAHFLIKVKFDFIGFRNDGSGWKAVYQARENSSCEFVDGSERTMLTNKNASFKNYLVVIVNAVPEVLLDIPMIEESVAHRKNRNGQDVEIPYWRFVRMNG